MQEQLIEKFIHTAEIQSRNKVNRDTYKEIAQKINSKNLKIRLKEDVPYMDYEYDKLIDVKEKQARLDREIKARLRYEKKALAEKLKQLRFKGRVPDKTFKQEITPINKKIDSMEDAQMVKNLLKEIDKSELKTQP